MAVSEMTNKGSFPVPNPTTSYWLKWPHHLASYRSRETVPKECDIAIIGTGMAGVCTAYQILSRAKPDQRPKVVLLEARQVCSGATGRNGGHTKLAPENLMKLVDQFGPEKTDQVAADRMKVLRGMKALVDKEKLDCEFMLRRSFDVFWDEAQAKKMKESLQNAIASGYSWPEDIQWLEGENLEKVTGVKGIKGATTCPAASLWPYKFVTQLLERTLQLGAELYAETLVESVTEKFNTNILKTSRGELHATKVVFATNAYTRALLPQYSGVITPRRGVNSHVEGIMDQDRSKQPPFLGSTYNLRYGETTDYLVPQPDGSVILGGASPAWRKDDNWWDIVDDSVIMDGVDEYLKKTMTQHLSQWENVNARMERTWTGIMGDTPDGMPRVGKVPGRERQWMLCGFNGGGMLFIYTISEAIAKMVNEGLSIGETGLPLLYQSAAAE